MLLAAVTVTACAAKAAVAAAHPGLFTQLSQLFLKTYVVELAVAAAAATVAAIGWLGRRALRRLRRPQRREWVYDSVTGGYVPPPNSS